MAAVVDDDVETGDLLTELGPEVAVGLIADEYFNVVGFKCLAGRVDVDAVDLALGAEVVSPHFEAAAGVDPDSRT